MARSVPLMRNSPHAWSGFHRLRLLPERTLSVSTEGRRDVLTFELVDNDELFIHADSDGLRLLVDKIEGVLAELTDSAVPKPAHTHLMTAEWGGSDLSDEPQGDGKVLSHVKIYCWPGDTSDFG